MHICIHIYFFVGRGTPCPGYSCWRVARIAERVSSLWKENIWNWSSQCINVAALSFVRCSAKTCSIYSWNSEREMSARWNRVPCLCPMVFSLFVFERRYIYIQWKREWDWERARQGEWMVPAAPVCMRACMCECVRYRKKVYTSKNDIYVGSYDFRIYNVNRFVAQTASRTKSTIVEW